MKKTIRRIFNLLGWDLRRRNAVTSPEVQLLKALETVKIDVIFDIGANTGQFARGLRSEGYRGRLISFEPLSSARKELTRLADNDVNWTVHSQAAIGSTEGEVEINISGNSVSSSLLPMLESHSGAAANSSYIGRELVPVVCLDSVAMEYLEKDSNLFIKIDTQGYEWQVLDGAQQSLQKAKGVLCELSLIPLYEGGHLWRDLIDRLQSEGFVLWAIQKGFIDPRNGRSLQVDAVFLRLP